MSALLFLYREVVGRPLELGTIVRARQPVRTPLVLARQEVEAVLACMRGPPRLMAFLIYGSGLRLAELASTPHPRIGPAAGRRDRMCMRRYVTLVVLLSGCLAVPLLADPQDSETSPFSGTWVANIEKSRRHPNHQFQSANMEFTVAGNTVTLKHGGVNALTARVSGVDGSGAHFDQVIVFDRK